MTGLDSAATRRNGSNQRSHTPRGRRTFSKECVFSVNPISYIRPILSLSWGPQVIGHHRCWSTRQQQERRPRPWAYFR